MDNVHSSLQSLYALKLLEKKYKAEIEKLPATPFKLDKEVSRLELISKKQVVKNSPRFTIVDVSYRTPDGKVNYSTYESSRDSIEAVLLAKDDVKPNEYNLIVSKQQRSPFVINKEFPNGVLNEFTGGMLEEGQTIEDAAVAEAGQEQTFSLEKGNLILLARPFVASLSAGEFGCVFMAITDKTQRTEQQLDKGEKENSGETISNRQEYLSLNSVAKDMHLIDPAPVAAKLGVLLVDSYMQNMKEKQNSSNHER